MYNKTLPISLLSNHPSHKCHTHNVPKKYVVYWLFLLLLLLVIHTQSNTVDFFLANVPQTAALLKKIHSPLPKST